MGEISRHQRAQMQAHAQQVRRQGQLAGWSVARIVATIVRDLPEVRLLEAWRLAYGWSRPQVVASVVAGYTRAGLPAPGINSSMLCRWEHGQSDPGVEYGEVLSHLYDVPPEQLGLPARSPTDSLLRSSHIKSRRSGGRAQAIHQSEEAGGKERMALAAVGDSISLALELEGAGGGPFTRDQLDRAIQYYAVNYSMLPPDLLSGEVHRCRAVVAALLRQSQPAAARTELRRIAGWLSALLGNLTFHSADYAAASIHLSIAARLGTDIGHRQLTAWALGASSMLARHQHRYPEALNLARQAVEHADTMLRRAQAIAWAKLPALAYLGRRDEAREAISAAQRELNAAPHSAEAGRFGFDVAELELHFAEAELVLGDAAAAAAHALSSLAHTSAGRPSWAAATLTLARSEVYRGRPDQGAELALQVLDTTPAGMLRETSRQRLAALDDHLVGLGRPGTVAADLHQRLRALAPHSPTSLLSLPT